jgi:hypothetical protein
VGEGSSRIADSGSPYGASDGSPRATGGEGPRAAVRTEVDCGGVETSPAEHGSRPHGSAWGLRQAPPVQEIEPSDQTVSILVLELLCYSFLTFVVTHELT